MGNPFEGLQKLGTALGERPHEIVPFLVLLLPLLGFVVLSLFGPAIVVS